MVEKKDGHSASHQNLSVQKIKATTGAWWKSTVKENKKKTESKPVIAVTKKTQKQITSQATEKRAFPKSVDPVEKKQETKVDASKERKAVPEKVQEVNPEKKESGKNWRSNKKYGQRPNSSRKRGRRTSYRKRADTTSSSSSPQKKAVPGKKHNKEERVVFTEIQTPKYLNRFRRRRLVQRAWLKQQIKITPLQAILGEPFVATGLALVDPMASRESADKQGKRFSKGGYRKGHRPRKGHKGNKPAIEEQKELESKVVERTVETVREEKKNDGPQPVIKLLINAEEPEECRLALLEDGRLESLNVSTVTRAHTKNNIYKAKIVAIEPNLQAAFVDYGTEKNGFLPFSEIHPEYYKQDVSEKVQHLIDTHQWKKLSIAGAVEKGQEVLVQVVKEEVGKKGANMTTYLSLPGRCVVLMPGSDSTGISRKIVGEERRRQLREAMRGMDIPEGIGWIVRTASIDITENALSRDVTYLSRLWEEVKKKGQTLQGVGLIYQDQNSVLRFLREHFDPAIEEILVDDKTAMEQVRNFISLQPSNQQSVKVKLHRGARPIFNQFSVEDQIESIYQPQVNLPSGGSIVIDPTEALVAIDVNSGSTSKGQNFEASIFQANMEAATELARQLRLRDLGGLIVVDFIDMRSKKNIREVEKQVKNAMRHDKAKVDMSRISKFGLMQISRQKLGAPIEAGNYRVCEHCKGRGTVRSVETLALFYLRRIQTGASRKVVGQVEGRFPLDVAQYLLNNKRQEIRELELKYGADILIVADPTLKPADHDLIFHKLENGK
jgi:ribonuclease E